MIYTPSMQADTLVWLLSLCGRYFRKIDEEKFKKQTKRNQLLWDIHLILTLKKWECYTIWKNRYRSWLCLLKFQLQRYPPPLLLIEIFQGCYSVVSIRKSIERFAIQLLQTQFKTKFCTFSGKIFPQRSNFPLLDLFNKPCLMSTYW